MNAYANSVALEKLRQVQAAGRPLRLAFLDVDGTWAGVPTDQVAVRQILEDRGYTIACITSRLSEACITSDAMSPEFLAATAGLRDADIVGSRTATELLVKQISGAYAPDQEYLRHLPANASTWRSHVTTLLEHARQQDASFQIRNPQDVDLVPYRFELEPASAADCDSLLNFLNQPAHTEIEVVDDSRRSLTPPVFTIFITPKGLSKFHSMNHVVSSLSRLLSADPTQWEITIAGDTLGELPAGLQAARGTHVTFVVPAGSPLYHDLTLTKAQKMATVGQGIYQAQDDGRTIVLGDEAFPGLTGPKTLFAWFKNLT